MYNVALNSDIDSNSINKTFSCYIRARDYANRLFHKRYTLSIREQGYPADDFIVFKNTIFSDTEEITVYNRQETFTLSVFKIAAETSGHKPNNNRAAKDTNKSSKDNMNGCTSHQNNFDKKIYSIKDYVGSIHIRQLLITKILENKPLCPECGGGFCSKNNITIKKIDNRIGYTRANCFLKHRECRKSDVRTNIQFMFSE